RGHGAAHGEVPGVQQGEDDPGPAEHPGHLRPEDRGLHIRHLSCAKPGLITPLIRASRSSNGMKADFIAFTVNHCRSSQPYPNASTSLANSRERLVPLISRLSVFTVTRKQSRRS